MEIISELTGSGSCGLLFRYPEQRTGQDVQKDLLKADEENARQGEGNPRIKGKRLSIQNTWIGSTSCRYTLGEGERWEVNRKNIFLNGLGKRGRGGEKEDGKENKRKK